MDGMNEEKNINKFFDVIDGLNKQAISHIRSGDFDKAIGIYNLKIKFINFAYLEDIICVERAISMTEDTQTTIRTLRKEQINETNK